MVGLFCLTFDEKGKLSRQGEVIGEAANGYYLVQWFDWLVGAPGDIMLTPVKVMWEDGWMFYRSADDWREAAAQFSGTPRRVSRKEA